ncbi:MAG: DUF87 domain-containing protein [Phycisphaerae bacterium]|nr:DUF87 domain-containing protein [Phycisphaerae bacterium]
MTTATELYRLDKVTVTNAYVDAIFGELKSFLLCKNQGHCQRIDFLPRRVLARLAQRLAGDADLKAQQIVCRMVTDKADDEEPEAWEVTGSGAVALREDATYGRIKVFCAMFPVGIRLAEEDSLNISTFKTDDAESFDIEKCLLRHLRGKVNELPSAEADVLRAILDSEAVRRRPTSARLEYVLAVLGERSRSDRPADWEVAGAYLYEVHLIPDFGLAPDILTVQIDRNAKCADILCDGEKNLTQNLDRLSETVGLEDEGRRRELDVYLAEKNTLQADEWMPPVCHDEAIREKLSFECWQFTEPAKGIKVELAPLRDPKKPSKVTKGLMLKSDALVNDGSKSIRIRWTVSPKQPAELGGFRVTVVRRTEEEGELDVIPPQSIGAKRKSFMVPMADNNLEKDEKCVARIQIHAVSKTGSPLPNAVDESEEFWIENGEEFTPPPAERGTSIRHLDELSFRVTHKNGKTYDVRNRGWNAKRDYVFNVRLTNNARGDLTLNPILLEVERMILRTPENLGAIQVDAVNKRRAEVKDFRPVHLPENVQHLTNNFYLARRRFFSRIVELNDGTGVIEVADLHDCAEEAMAYVQKYLEMLGALKDKIEAASGPGGVNTALHDYCTVMRIDTVLMDVGPYESPMQVLLLAPTHPLRVLWLYQFEMFVRRWIQQMNGRAPGEIEKLISEDSIDKLVSLNIPNAVCWGRGKVFVNTDNLGLFWSILPDGQIDDLRTAVNAARQVLGSAAREVVISTVTPRQIADKIERYLCHHPYVRTLKVNVVNPGDGMLLLEAIKQLLGKPLYADLNFDVKFFAPQGTRHQLVGNAFDDLMEQRDDEEWTRGKTLSETEERLLKPNANPLFPKLMYAKHTIAELLDDQEGRFDSHLTFVIDFFGTTVATRNHDLPTGSSALHNLLAEYVTDYTAGETTATWSRMIAPNRCPDLASDGNTERLFRCHDGLGHLVACFFDWGKSLDRYVTVQLELTDEHGKNHIRMLRKVHMMSDWVFTIDRNFGIEFYDDPQKGPGAGSTGGYLIDYTPEFLDAVSHRLIISTYHQQEIESILRIGFDELLKHDDGDEETGINSYTVSRVLQVLKSVSGKLALKLINNPSQAQEVIGLALTRLALEQEGRLLGRVLIPVDSHIDLFFQARKELENKELTLKRTDLMLVEFRGRQAHIDLIEVKNRKYTSPKDMLDLQTEIAAKNGNTEGHFRANFMASEGVKRFDADIKNKELANIIAFYFERARRYSLFQPQEAEVPASDAEGSLEQEFRKGVEAIAAGACEFTFRHQGFIYNGSSSGDIDTKIVHNNDIYTVGRAGIWRLLGLVLPPEEEAPVEPSEEPEPTIGPTPPVATADVRLARSEPETEEKPLEPQPSVEAEREARREQEKAEAPPAGAAPAGELEVYLGQNLVTGEEVLWNPYTTEPRRLANQHLLVVGKSGAGKSETTKALIWEMHRKGVPSIIFDYQGEYASGPFYDAVKPQVFDVMDGLPINPFELPIDPITKQRKSPLEMVFRLADTLNTVFSGSGDIQLGILREAIEECYSQQGFHPRAQNTWDSKPPTLEMLEAVLEQWASDRGAQVRNLMVRLQPLFKGGIFREDEAGFQFDELFAKTTVVRMTSGIKDLMLAASRFLLEKIYAAMLMAGVTKRIRVMVCVDEAHKLCGDETITNLVKEARKYGLGLILSSQETRDFHSSIFANAGTIVCLGLEEVDAEVMSKNLGMTRPDQRRAAKELILNQASGQALVRSQHFLPYWHVQIKSFEDRTGPA